MSGGKGHIAKELHDLYVESLLRGREAEGGWCPGEIPCRDLAGLVDTVVGLCFDAASIGWSGVEILIDDEWMPEAVQVDVMPMGPGGWEHTVGVSCSASGSIDPDDPDWINAVADGFCSAGLPLSAFGYTPAMGAWGNIISWGADEERERVKMFPGCGGEAVVRALDAGVTPEDILA